MQKQSAKTADSQLIPASSTSPTPTLQSKPQHHCHSATPRNHTLRWLMELITLLCLKLFLAPKIFLKLLDRARGRSHLMPVVVVKELLLLVVEVAHRVPGRCRLMSLEKISSRVTVRIDQLLRINMEEQAQIKHRAKRLGKCNRTNMVKVKVKVLVRRRDREVLGHRVLISMACLRTRHRPQARGLRDLSIMGMDQTKHLELVLGRLWDLINTAAVRTQGKDKDKRHHLGLGWALINMEMEMDIHLRHKDKDKVPGNKDPINTEWDLHHHPAQDHGHKWVQDLAPT